MKTYSTYNEAVQNEIINAIEATGVVTNAWHDYDIDSIADNVITSHVDIDENGIQHGNVEYMIKPGLTTDDFWQIVQDNETIENPMILKD